MSQKASVSKGTVAEITDEIIESLHESLDNPQIRHILKRLLESQKEKDRKISKLKKQINELECNRIEHALQTAGPSAFDTLFTTNVPHILQKIFLSLDLESYKTCQKVSSKWNQLLTSTSFIKEAKILFKAVIPSYEDDLWIMARRGRSDEVRELLSIGLLNPSRLISFNYEQQSTPLFEAADRGHTEVVKLLLDAGVDPNEYRDSFGRTPLWISSYHGHKSVVKLLLDNGAKTNAVHNRACSPLHIATRFDDIDVVELLLDSNADPNAAAEHDWVPLHFAARNGSKQMTEILLDKGADPNMVDEKGWTPLSIALHYNRLQVANILKARGGMDMQ